MFKKLTLILGLVLLGLTSLPFEPQATPINMKVSPAEILINTTYNGTTITVTGEIPRECDAAILLTGDRETVHFKKKGKALGLLWMNMGTVVFENIPKAYLLYTGKSLSELSQNQSGENNEPGIGFRSLQQEVTITAETKEAVDEVELFEDFLKLKKSEDLYGIFENSVSYQPAGETSTSFSATLTIPPRLKKGSYIVNVYAIKDGGIVDKASQDLNIKEVGFPAFISTMAYEHSALYGVLAAVIAIIAGLLIGFIFTKKPKK